jgi:hypothetical protein
MYTVINSRIVLILFKNTYYTPIVLMKESINVNLF